MGVGGGGLNFGCRGGDRKKPEVKKLASVDEFCLKGWRIILRRDGRVVDRGGLENR